MSGGENKGVEPKAVGGEAELPLEYTARVAAHRAAEAPTRPTPAPAEAGVERARRARRRERDDRAERRAIQIILATFLGCGGLAIVAINLLDDSSPTEPEPPRAAEAPRSRRAAPPAPRPSPAPRSAPSLSEVPDIPAIRLLQSTGLTIGAEGIPKVEVDDGVDAGLAGREACRFAYAVWEFSPNETFRFLSTCRGLGGPQLVGGYQVRGTEVYLSTLASDDARWAAVFSVEHPSVMRSQVRAGAKGLQLEVTQRVTVVRGGLHGDDFRDSFQRRNRLSVPKTRSEPPPRSPLEQILEKGR